MVLSKSLQLIRIIFFLGVALRCPSIQNCYAEEKITIGVSAPLTGSVASWGQELRRLLDFANKTIANDRYTFIYEDDMCDGKASVTVAHKLISIDSVKYMLGGLCSGSVLAAAPVYEQSKVLYVGSGGASPDISKAGDYIFRTWPSDSKAIKLISDHIITSNYKKVGIIAQETAYALGYANGIKDFLTTKNIPVVFASFGPDTTDFKAVLQQMRHNEVDALLLSPQSEATALQLVQQAKQQGLKMPLLGSIAFGTDQFLKSPTYDCRDCVYPGLPTPDTILDSIIGKFEAAEGKVNVSYQFARSAFQSFIALDAAIQSKKDPKTYLYESHFSEPWLGSWSFDANGDIQGVEPALMRDGKLLK